MGKSAPMTTPIQMSCQHWDRGVMGGVGGGANSGGPTKGVATRQKYHAVTYLGHGSNARRRRHQRPRGQSV